MDYANELNSDAEEQHLHQVLAKGMIIGTHAHKRLSL